jgi:putative transposase
MSLDDARGNIEAWRQDYNESHPHSALASATPAEFARRCWLQPATTMSKEPKISTSERY